jgi:hypothetical protein
MPGSFTTSHPVTVLATRMALGLVAAVVVLGEILVIIGAESLAVRYPEFAHLRFPFVLAALAVGACVEVAVLLTAVLVGYAEDRRIFEPTALRLVDCLIGTVAVGTLIVGAVLTAIPGPPVLALLVLGGAVTGAACALGLSRLRARLRRAAVRRAVLDEVA